MFIRYRPATRRAAEISKIENLLNPGQARSVCHCGEPAGDTGLETGAGRPELSRQTNTCRNVARIYPAGTAIRCTVFGIGAISTIKRSAMGIRRHQTNEFRLGPAKRAEPTTATATVISDTSFQTEKVMTAVAASSPGMKYFVCQP